MYTPQRSTPSDPKNADRKLRFDLGTFTGINLQTQAALERRLTAQEVVDWDHERDGTAEFRPSGDRPVIELIFGEGNVVSAAELQSLDRVLQALWGDSVTEYLKIYSAVNDFYADLATATARDIENLDRHLFFGDDFDDLRDEAADALLAYYWPEGHHAAQTSRTAGLFEDTDGVLQWMKCLVGEVDLGDQLALIVVRYA